MCPGTRKLIFFEVVNLLLRVLLHREGTGWGCLHGAPSRESVCSALGEICHFQETLYIIFATRRQRLRIMFYM